jgi:mediator of RNA polymerase II transcription subunit 31
MDQGLEADRFYVELEFVQNLANARYLNYLGVQGYYDDPQFIDYLKYLRYWRDPQYMKYLMFPQCLEFLEVLIENPNFRKEISLPPFMQFVHQQQGLEWMHGTSMIEGISTSDNTKMES